MLQALGSATFWVRWPVTEWICCGMTLVGAMAWIVLSSITIRITRRCSGTNRKGEQCGNVLNVITTLNAKKCWYHRHDGDEGRQRRRGR